MRIKTVDLFCGIGGLTNGLIKAGLPVVAGIDVDGSCEYAYTHNNNCQFIRKSIEDIKSSEINALLRDADYKVLVGCAPCQPFSTHSNKVKNKEASSKWNLLNEFLRIIQDVKPDVVSMENVPNLSNKEIFISFVNELKSIGYVVSYRNVYCPDYGIPQKRRRLVLLASMFEEITIINKTHVKNDYATVRDAIGTLERLRNGQKSKTDKLHYTTRLSKKNHARIKASKPNRTWQDWDDSLKLDCQKKETGSTYKSVYGRMSWNEPSPTLTTQFFNYGTGRFGHPEQNRALTLREGALLQSFPLEYEFISEGQSISLKSIARHIGNAVPPRLGEVIGLSIIAHIKEQSNEL